MVRKGTRKTAAKAPDIRTVAALAKVSIATVSRTINGSPAVSERLSKRVWQAIEHLNYFPTPMRAAWFQGAAAFWASLSRTSPTRSSRS